MTKAFGNRIRKRREQMGFSCAQLAARLHISRSTVNSWENGESRPNTEHLILLARLLHTSTDYLLDCEPANSLCLDAYDPLAQDLIFRMLRYFDGISSFTKQPD